MNLKAILFFDAMLTPKIITFVYWFALACALLLGVGTVLYGLGSLLTGSFAFGLLKIVAGVLIAAFGAVSARMYSEFFIVIFKINDNLKAIAEK